MYVCEGVGLTVLFSKQYMAIVVEDLMQKLQPPFLHKRKMLKNGSRADKL
jgi:hypothetical protein